MKKLLSLLSVLTISGTSVPTTIAASHYQKEEIICQEIENVKNKTGILREFYWWNNNDYEKIFFALGLDNNFYFIEKNKNDKIENKKYYKLNVEDQIIQEINYNAWLLLENNPDFFRHSTTIGYGDFKFKEKQIYNSPHSMYINCWDENNNRFINFDIIEIPKGFYFNSFYFELNDKFYLFLKKDGENIYQHDINWKIYEYDPFELIESDIIYMKEQIKRGLYLEYKKQSSNSVIKDILNINLENLTISDVIINQNQKNKSSNLEQDLNNVCNDSNSTFINNSDTEQTQNTASCSKQLTETNTFQKMNGFSKSKTTSNTDNWNANVNTKVTTKASGSVGIPLVAEGKVEVSVEVGSGYTWGGSKSYTIGDTSNSSDTEIKTTTNTTTITVPSQPVKVPPHSKISISVNSWQNNIGLILSYYQKVEGVVSGDFIDQNNNKTTISISIKDAMLNLQENNILPSKIKINNDNSINFSYDIKTEEQIIMHQTKISEAIPLS